MHRCENTVLQPLFLKENSGQF